MATTVATDGDDDWAEERRGQLRGAAWFALVTVLVFLYPLVDEALGIQWLGDFEAIFIFLLLALGLNIVVGYSGLLDLGYAAFFAIGAYSMAFLTSPSSVFIREGYVPGFLQHFWPAMAVCWAVAAVFGVLLGVPTLRLRGDYLAIVTLGFGEIVPNVFRNAEGVTGGIKGINLIAKPTTITLLGWKLSFGPTDQRNWFWLMVVVGLFSIFMIRRLYDSRLGRSWQAIREDELAASSMGVHLVTTKLWAFALGASFAGFAGSIFAAAFQIVDPSQFDFTISIMVLSMVILGGLGNIYGVIVGGILIASFDRILAEELTRPVQWFGGKVGSPWLEEHNVTEDRFVVFGLALVLMMLLRPGGLLPSARRRAELTPESEDIRVAESEQLYDVRHEEEPAAVGERA
jgi:branched-chain amino acid transport system permease protein